MTSDAINTHDEQPQPAHGGDAGQPPDETAARSSPDGGDSATLPGGGAATRAHVAAAGPGEEPGAVLRLQPRLMPRADGLYYVHEILAYHDEAFVEAAYASVLRRPPSEEEFWRTLADLRGGAREKIDILRDLARSNEGKAQVAFERIAGLRQSRLAQFARSIPVVGHLWRILAAVARLPTALRHQRQFEAYALAQQQIIADHVNARGTDGAGHVSPELQQSVADASAAVSLLSDALAEMTARLADDQTRLARQIDHVARQTEHAAMRLDNAERRLAEHDARLDDQTRRLDARLDDQTRSIDARLDEQTRRLDAQQEFLINEQRAIVEAQKAAVASAEEELREMSAVQRRELVALASRVEELRAAIDAARASAGGKV